ncbi:MAG: hypothetical protein WA903_07565, partial [Ornithinimicrobium sp.]
MDASRPSSGHLPRRTEVLVALVLALTSLGVAHPALAQTDSELGWSVTINERSVDDINSNEPLRLVPADGAFVEIELANPGETVVTVRNVRLDGQVMGLTMYNYTTRVDIEMPPDSITLRRIELDLLDLSEQAVGLIPSRVQLLDDDRSVLLEESFPADVRGSANSVYGVFALAVAGITAVLLGTLLWAIVRHRLPRNRWQRAMHFVPVGVGIGFVLTFTLSATRQLAPSAGSWVTLVFICGAVALAVGYFLPLGGTDDVAADGQDDEQGDVDAEEEHLLAAESEGDDD